MSDPIGVSRFDNNTSAAEGKLVSLADSQLYHILQNSSIDQLEVSGEATIQIAKGDTLTVTAGLSQGPDADELSVLHVTGGGKLVIEDNGQQEATIGSGHSITLGTLASFDDASIPAFSPGSLLDVTNADPLAKPVTTTATSSDVSTGGQDDRVVVRSVDRKATFGIHSHLSTEQTQADEFTVRTDGSGGALIGLTHKLGDGAASALDAEGVEQAYGVTGKGVTVGVISNGFDKLGGMAQDERNGALPHDVQVLSDAKKAKSDEGREMAELIHSIAPDARIMFADEMTNPGSSAISSEQGMANAINRLVGEKADVIVDDVEVLSESFWNPTGPVAQAIDAAAKKGVTFLTSAGNSGDAYFQGPIALEMAAVNLRNGQPYACNFASKDQPPSFFQHLTVGEGQDGYHDLNLQWQTAHGQPTGELSMTIFTKVGSDGLMQPLDPKDYTVTTQGDSERIHFRGSDPNTRDFYLAITSKSPNITGNLKYIVTNDAHATISNLDGGPNTGGVGSGAMYGHRLDSNEIDVGAVGYKHADPSNGSAPQTEASSSVGASSGKPGGADEPWVSGIDGTATDVSGSSKAFYGTSAAAPTVAAVVALMKQADPDITLKQIKAALAASAIPTTDALAGGYGLADAKKAVGMAEADAKTAGSMVVHTQQTDFLPEGEEQQREFSDQTKSKVVTQGAHMSDLASSSTQTEDASVDGAIATSLGGSSSHRLAGFAEAVADLLSNKQDATHYDTTHSQKGFQVDLSDPNHLKVDADCSAWVDYAMESVAPLHDAVLQGQRGNPDFNTEAHPYHAKAFSIDEAKKPWTQADVLEAFLGDREGSRDGFGAGKGTGFDTVDGIAHVRPGDVIAYALGTYTNPSAKGATNDQGVTIDKSLGLPEDTGHVMIADSKAKEVWTRDGSDTQRAAGIGPGLLGQSDKVYAVKVIDSSSVVHGHDTDKVDGKRSGVGEGTIWFATDAAGKVLQVKFDKGWVPSSHNPSALSLSVGRLSHTIDLSDVPLTDGKFVVDVHANAAPVLNGVDYGAQEKLTGNGTMLVRGGGTLRLDSSNDFTGSTEVRGDGTIVSVDASRGLGRKSATVTLGAGTTLDLAADMTFHHKVDLHGAAAIDVASGVTAQADGRVAAGTDHPSATLEVGGGGTLSLHGQHGTIGTTTVDKGTTLVIDSRVDHGGLTLDEGAKLVVNRDTTLDSLDVKAGSTIDIAKGVTMTVDQISGAGSADGANVTGGGTLTIAGRTSPVTGTDATEHMAADASTSAAGASQSDLRSLMGGGPPTWQTC
ncbi:S8 family serine peptidase [Methylobacterium oryzae CBMB20]